MAADRLIVLIPPRARVSTPCARAAIVGFAAIITCALSACREAPAPGQPIPVIATLGGLGDTPGRFTYPRCLENGAQGLWVIDRSARVQRIDPVTGQSLGFFHMPEFALGKPTGFCVAPGPDSAGAWQPELLYVADTHYHRVMVIKPPPVINDPRGTPESSINIITSFGTHGTGPGQFYYPTDVAVLFTASASASTSPPAIDRIFVSEYGGNDRISIFDANFRFLKSFGTFGNDPSPANIQFNRPQQLAINPPTPPTPSSPLGRPARLIVTDSCNHRIGVFSIDGQLIRWIGLETNPAPASPTLAPLTPGAAPADMPSTVDLPRSEPAHTGPARNVTVGQPARFSYPYGLVLVGDGTALISEFGASRVQHIDLQTGICLALWGRPGRGTGELALPWGITLRNGTVFVLDSANNRIQAFAGPAARSQRSAD